jgi:hypothetical protein
VTLTADLAVSYADVARRYGLESDGAVYLELHVAEYAGVSLTASVARVELVPGRLVHTFDVPLHFGGPGSYAVTMWPTIVTRYRVQPMGMWATWIRVGDSIDLTEYDRHIDQYRHRLPATPPAATDLELNLEPGDVPGIGITGPGEPDRQVDGRICFVAH